MVALNADGWKLFDAAVTWTASTATLAIAAPLATGIQVTVTDPGDALAQAEAIIDAVIDGRAVVARGGCSLAGVGGRDAPQGKPTSARPERSGPPTRTAR